MIEITKETEILSWAVKYWKYYSIIPVGLDKRPTTDWKKYQTEKADEAQIRAWFGGENPPNIGIVTGEISGITVVDVEAGGDWESYPVTQTAKTGNGGYHLYYRYAPGVKNSARIRTLTDIRGDGGFVVAPPSITDYMVNGEHKGGSYEWTRKEVTQPFPYGKFEILPEVKKDWQDLLGGTGQGERNQTAAQIIGKFLSALPPEDWMTTAWSMAVVWNKTNNPPLPESELRATFNSIMGREVRSGKRVKNDSKKDVLDDNQQEIVDIKLISQIAGDITDDMSVSYPTGYKDIDDNFMGGLKEGDLFFVTGYAGLGKSSFLQSMTYNLDKIGQPTMWFTFEMPIGELWRKFKDMGVGEAFQAYAPEKISNASIEWVKSKIIEARDRFKTKIIFIDHLGFLALDQSNYDKNVSNNLSTILSIICRQLKTLAIQEGVAIVLAGHVRKPDNSKGDLAPNIHSIKDSAGVSQESDAVVIIHRNRNKAYSGTGTDDVYESETHVIIEKNRRTGRNKMFSVHMFDGRLMEEKEAINRIIPF